MVQLWTEHISVSNDDNFNYEDYVLQSFLWETLGFFPSQKHLDNSPAPDEERFQSCVIISIEGIRKNLRRKLVMLNMEGQMFPYFTIFLKGSLKVEFLLHFSSSGSKLHDLSEL